MANKPSRFLPIKRKLTALLNYPFAKWLYSKLVPTVLFHGILISYVAFNINSEWLYALPAYGIIYYYLKTEFIYWISDFRKAWLNLSIEPEKEQRGEEI